VFRLSAAFRELTSATNSRGRDPLQDCVFGHGHYIFQFRLHIQKLQHRGMGKTTIQANPNAHSRETDANDPNQPAQQAYGAYGGGGIARTQHRGAQILFGFLIETDKAHHR
jgi:hypothetical protein